MTRSEPQAIQALKAYIAANFSDSISAFAAEKKLDRVQILRVLNGTRGKRMTVKLAADIERATEGTVPIALWAEDVDPNAAEDEAEPLEESSPQAADRDLKPEKVA